MIWVFVGLAVLLICFTILVGIETWDLTTEPLRRFVRYSLRRKSAITNEEVSLSDDRVIAVRHLIKDPGPKGDRNKTWCAEVDEWDTALPALTTCGQCIWEFNRALAESEKGKSGNAE